MAKLRSAAALQEPQEADSQDDDFMHKDDVDDDVNTSESQASLQAVYCAASQHPVLLSAHGGRNQLSNPSVCMKHLQEDFVSPMWHMSPLKGT